MAIVHEETEPPIPAMQFPVVFVDNLSEDVWPFISSLNSEAAKSQELIENVGLGDRQYLGARAEFGDELIFIAPGTLEEEFISYVDELLESSRPPVLVPSHHKGQLSEDVLSDPAVMAKLIGLRQICLIGYCSSKPFYRLMNRLKQEGVEVDTPEAPTESDFERTVMVYGTKTGLRLAIDSSKSTILGIVMPEGRVVKGKEEIVEEALRRNGNGSGVVIKTEKGHSGMGVVIIKPGEITGSIAEQSVLIKNKLEASNGYWEKFPAVVEAFVPTNREVGGGLPNVECRVNTNGKTEVLFSGGMRVRRGVYAGMELSQSALPHKYEKEVELIGIELGTWYSANGYRGYFDVDCMAGIDGQLYVCESNVRRTGVTWAHHVLRCLLGEKYLAGGRCIVTNYIKIENSEITQFHQVKSILKSILYSKDRGAGVIISSGRLVQMGSLNYLVIAPNRTEAIMFEKEIIRLLDTKMNN